MQINTYQQSPINTTSLQSKQSVATESAVKQQPVINSTDQVNISTQAKELSASGTKTAETLPITPEMPETGEKFDKYVEIKQAQLQYQVASDMMNIASGNNDGISAPTAAYLSNNEEARENALQHKTMQQQYQNMQSYAEQTQQAENNWVV